MANHTTTAVSQNLTLAILEALKNIRGWGSVEIFVQDYKVTQITERNITKTQHDIVKNTHS
ncbi:MAG: DUF2292 domain-containing protein [Candidatus Chisholmbacteria bacterium]|nr:DUF2292 domain-containing protein [Candidatus Chisholmbacteria bacterium]